MKTKNVSQKSRKESKIVRGKLAVIAYIVKKQDGIVLSCANDMPGKELKVAEKLRHNTENENER